MESLRRASWLVYKDLIAELRSQELVLGALFLSAVLVLVFAFAFMGADRPPLDVVVGILWTTVIISGTVAIGRMFERERENGTFAAILLAPIERPAVFLAKLVSVAVLMSLVEAIVLAALALLFSLSLGRGFAIMIIAVALGTLGFASIASLFGAALGKARGRDVLLFLLVYPLIVPIIIAGTRASALALAGEPSRFWLEFLAVFDLIFIALGLWVFEPIAAGDA